jgi:hypothetical protein
MNAPSLIVAVAPQRETHNAQYVGTRSSAIGPPDELPPIRGQSRSLVQGVAATLQTI